MLDAATKYFQRMSGDDKRDFRFVQVSTDEVYGSCDAAASFCETSPHAPNSPYSASKAAGDHFARAWFHTFGLPTIVTHCSNNYGPYQHPEKFIPTVVRHALAGRSIPVYGTGENRRDWIHVDDHVTGLLAAAERGVPGERYNLGADEEMTNLALAHTICAQLDALRPRNDGAPHADLITFVTDRPGHDLRYAIDSRRALDALGWRPSRTFREGIAETVQWYLANPDWLANARGELGRLGLSGRA
jgi:dTDP-glucose 4,6-dehydratase